MLTAHNAFPEGALNCVLLPVGLITAGVEAGVALNIGPAIAPVSRVVPVPHEAPVPYSNCSAELGVVEVCAIVAVNPHAYTAVVPERATSCVVVAVVMLIGTLLLIALTSEHGSLAPAMFVILAAITSDGSIAA